VDCGAGEDPGVEGAAVCATAVVAQSTAVSNKTVILFIVGWSRCSVKVDGTNILLRSGTRLLRGGRCGCGGRLRWYGRYMRKILRPPGWHGWLSFSLDHQAKVREIL
jgi:hypothetical protein